MMATTQDGDSDRAQMGAKSRADNALIPSQSLKV